MVRKGFVLGVALVALLVLLWVTGAVVAGPPLEGPEGDVSIAATVGSKISYQGVLKETGNPVTGNRNMVFRLYSDAACTTQVGSDIVKSGVQVTDGLFSVDLAVTHSHFNGQGLWLEAEVGGTKIGCQEILPVPYALSLRPGARVVGEQTGWNAIYAHNTATTDYSYGVYGRTDSISYGASGVFGEATIGSTFGVYGRADGSNSFASGVFGEATATSAQTYGVRGYSASTSGFGVYGHATAASGTTYGVKGQSASTSGRGVYGYATATSGTTYGVYGRSMSPSGAAIYGDGDVKQNRTGDGLVKAAVYLLCSDCMFFCYPDRSFNNVTADTIGCFCGANEGHCTIDFTFDISDRFWVATAVGGGDDGVNCWLGGNNDELDCYRWDATNGTGTDGDIMVLVY